MPPPRPKYNRFTASSAASSTSLLSNNDGIHSQSAYSWGVQLNVPEDDDDLHNPSPGRDRLNDRGGIFSIRGLANVGCYPIISHFTARVQTTQGGFNLGGINATGQIAEIPGNWGLIDLDTPQEVHTKADYMNGDDWVLVFSDEFNTDGRTFYPGDDPYWEAVDLHYWQTGDLEWYDPSGATTKDGYLQLRLERAIPEDNHNMSYKSGMVGTVRPHVRIPLIHTDSNVSLPGDSTISGLWPAIWTMGNLGRAGFGASLEGMWPYSYDSCDVGTLPNQTYPGTQTPLAAVENGDPANNDELPLVHARVSRIPVPSGPTEHMSDVRRLRSTSTKPSSQTRGARCHSLHSGHLSTYPHVLRLGWVGLDLMIFVQAQYDWFNTSENLIIPDPDNTLLNPYKGGAFQQTTSGLSFTNPDCYEGGTGCFSVYGFQYQPGGFERTNRFDNGYITWVNNDQIAWTIMQAGLAQDPQTEIGPRPIPQEPMYIIANLGFSLNFGDIDFENIQLPATMRVDWIRVYQPANARKIGCDPSDFPTAAYINAYMEAYTNANLTTWRDDFHQEWPKNKLMPEGC
ncbi:hypothetical protein C0995_003582 [Termitomyces sp. Mi166|nr:hypothetical protein C0995_003582 [Termitomyces sp. Mi166\